MLGKVDQSADSWYPSWSRELIPNDAAELGEACDGLAEELFDSEFVV